MRKGEILPVPNISEEEAKCLTSAQRYYRRNVGYTTKWRHEHKEHAIAYQRKYYSQNKQTINKRNHDNRLKKINIYKAKEKVQRLKVKSDVIRHYGGKCLCCGETRLDFLTLDHINNDGARHRRTFGRSQKIHRFLRTHNYPEGYQVLCFNCNYSKFYNHGKCIHQIEREGIANVTTDLGLWVGQLMS